MTGAIEYMHAWRDICDKQFRCYNCPIDKVCPGYMTLDDDNIAKLVRAVMAESRKKEGGDEDEETGDYQS